MKFKFSKNLDFQLDAIKAIADLFDTGKNIVQAGSSFDLQSLSPVIANRLEIDTGRILKNLQVIQKNNNIEQSENVNSFDFSVEMETGTGKTYVYLRTILELNKKYGLKKFIILVPSVAIREGVLKTIEQTKEHFREIYNIGFGYFAYDSDKLSKVREFVSSNDVQIMIMTIQSFNTDTNIMRQTPDRFHGDRPIDLVAETKPVVIMDEPQNMESELAKASISDLNPLFKLRYSATHREIHNLVYRLTPVDAYRRGLVKKIAVCGVKESDPGAFIFKVKDIITKRGENPKAKVIIEVKNANGEYGEKEITITAGDDIFRKSKQNPKYHDIFVEDVNATHARVELSDGKFYELEEMTEDKELIFRTQIKETIKAHFDKQEEVGDEIKVLSLFFIDKVDNYVHEDSLIRKLFIEEFNRLKRNYDRFKKLDAESVHKGYFASKKTKGVVEYQDSTTGAAKADKEAYDLIMKNKEQLLSFSEPVSFIFSHSALKEGWDNPNIFQICTLRETRSEMKKRQEIGRGLRLPVDINGDRVENQDINILTVVANSSYEEYANGLQEEFNEAGYTGEIRPRNAKEKKITVKTTKYLVSEEFKELWKKISNRTKFSLEVLTDKLIKNSVEKINKLDIRKIVVSVEKGEIHFNELGQISSSRENTSIGQRIERYTAVGNFIDRIASETSITRKTIFNIISKVNNLYLIFENPEEYIRSVILTIKAELNDMLVSEGLKYIPTGEVWEIKLLFSDFEALPSRSIKSERSVFERTVFDSKGEEEFARNLEQNSHIKVYTKLPRGFVVDTPLGSYIPDWAIVYKTPEGEKLYLVRETKFDYENLERELTWEEKQKIKCAEKHFAAIKVDYKVSVKKDLSDLR